MLRDTSWQATADEGFDLPRFAIDWERQTVTCPQGKTSFPWTPATRDDSPFFQVRFATGDGLACPVRARCTRAATWPRQRSLRPRDEHAALQLARERQATGAFAARYRRRAGVEGTIAQGVRAGRARYRTLPKVRLEHVAIAVGSSLQRLDAWWTGTARATTRTSRFAALAID